MLRSAGLAVVSALLLQAGSAANTRVGDGVAYTAEGRLKLPEKYREWVFLSSGMDMSYDPKPMEMDMGAGVFNNVFVNPEAYRAYQQTGHWPDGTMLVLENRGAALGSAHDPFLKAGKVQTPQLTGLEVHVLDKAHVPGDGWAFYGFGNDKLGTLIPRPAGCYSCHEQHAAVDTTFVQFYPTLLPAANKYGTVSPAYLKEMKAR